MKPKRIKLSRISFMHYMKFLLRSGLFLAAALLYIIGRLSDATRLFGTFERPYILLLIIWSVFAVEMVCRFFPARVESMGCQKQFRQNYSPVPNGHIPEGQDRKNLKDVFLAAGFWLLLNALIGVLYFTGVIDRGILILICMAFSVCDMICILFFCPFQTWLMKNKCCGTCRIYNWDYAMMFTPLFFVRSLYTWSLLALALILLIQWELLYYLHPERFAEETNASLSCANCQEKLCAHKTQLRRFLLRQKSRLPYLHGRQK